MFFGLIGVINQLKPNIMIVQRESNMNDYQINDLENVCNGIIAAEWLLNSQANDKIEEILRSCNDNTLHFSDADNGDDLSIDVDGGNFLVDSVRLEDDCILLYAKNGMCYHPYEADVENSTLLTYMVAELKRESNLK